MRLVSFFFCTVSILFILADFTVAEPRPAVSFSSKVIPQGGTIIIKIRAGKGVETPEVIWMDNEISLIPSEDGNLLQGFLSADLQEKTGRYKVLVRTSPFIKETAYDIEVATKDYGVRRLSLPEKMVDLDEETLKRVRKESDSMNRLWKAPSSSPAWQGSFVRPVPGETVGPFGRKSIINDQPRSPHTGVDMRGSKGTPIKAVNNGTVVLTGNHFFTGHTVVLDHGGSVMSMYFHCDRLLVNEGDEVAKGQVIASVGSTGRATGPHLHFGMRVNGSRVDPLRLIELSKELEE